MTPYDLLLKLMEEADRRTRRKSLYGYYPDNGPLRRELYQKHLAFFRGGVSYRERAAIAANRVGKTEGMGGYELTLHLTGKYPDWWEGRRFDHPVDAWAAGTTGLTTRDIIQAKLLGKPEKESEWGTGLIPGDLILTWTMHRGIPHAVESILVKHVSGGVSVVNLKSYEQGRKKFEGTSKHIVWFDEEPPLDIYTEGLLRTMDCNGMVMCTFTPLEGLSDVVLMYMPGGQIPKDTGNLQRFVVFADWNDVPHLDEKAKIELYNSLPPHQRDARSKGIPSLGSGAIYPVAEELITVNDFVLPVHWPRAFALDVGWQCTAALWAAVDRESQTAYLYSCYKAGHLEPPIHASAIKTRGAWIPGVGDAAAVSQMDGEKMITIYRAEGLDLELPDKSVEAGIYDVWTGLSNSSIKVFKSLTQWFDEFRIYRRDEKGQIVKSNDHLMDCTRYLKRSGLARAKARPVTLDIDTFQPQFNKPSAMCM